MPLWNISPVQRRLAVALGISVLLHAWLMESHYGKGAARRGLGDPLMVVRILPPMETTGSLSRTHDPADSGVTRNDDLLSVAPAYPPAPKVMMEAAGVGSTRAASDSAAVLPQPNDPTYYAAGDLDVFPSALVKPDLSAALGAGSGAGRVRATVLIDEAGLVDAVRGVDAPASDVATSARELLLRTRFTPARNKDGRIVEAQVLVALDYDTRVTPTSR